METQEKQGLLSKLYTLRTGMALLSIEKDKIDRNRAQQKRETEALKANQEKINREIQGNKNEISAHKGLEQLKKDSLRNYSRAKRATTVNYIKAILAKPARLNGELIKNRIGQLKSLRVFYRNDFCYLRGDYENCQINKEYIVNSRKMCYNIYAYYTYKEKRYE